MTTEDNVQTKHGMEAWQEIVKNSREKMAAFPLPRRPRSEVDDLEVPDDVEGLSGIQLANLLLALQSWYAYSTAQLAFVRSDLAAFEELFEVKLGLKMRTLTLQEEVKHTKDVLKAMALSTEPMSSLLLKKIDLTQRVTMLEGFTKSLEIQCKALTGEQIRRHAAQKLAQNEF